MCFKNKKTTKKIQIGTILKDHSEYSKYDVFCPYFKSFLLRWSNSLPDIQNMMAEIKYSGTELVDEVEEIPQKLKPKEKEMANGRGNSTTTGAPNNKSSTRKIRKDQINKGQITKD